MGQLSRDRFSSKIIFPKGSRFLRIDLSQKRGFDRNDTMGYYLQKVVRPKEDSPWYLVSLRNYTQGEQRCP